MSTVSWSNARWYKMVPSPKVYSVSGKGTGKTFRPKTRKHLNLDEWIATQPNRVFFLTNENWSEFNYRLNDYEARSLVIPDGDETYEYLTGSEYVRMWDHFTSFDTEDIANAGADFTAYSKVFKVFFNNENLFEVIEDAIQRMWSAYKEKSKLKDSVDARFSFIYDKKSIGKEEKLRGAQSIVFSRDLKKRYDLISAVLEGGDSTEVFRLVMASLLSRPEPFDSDFVGHIAGLGSRHGGKAVFDMVVDGLDLDTMVLMLDYGIDRELATSTASA